MPKTGSQIQAWAESLTEQLTFTPESVLIWINEFLTQEIGADAMLLDSTDYNTVGGVWEPLSNEFVGKFKVDNYYDSGMADTAYAGQCFDYEIFNGTIKFKYAGYYRLHFMTSPPEIAAIGSSIAVDDCFNKAAALWVAYRGLTNDDEDNAYQSSLGQLRRQEYYQEKPEAIKRRKAQFHKKGTRIRNVQF